MYGKSILVNIFNSYWQNRVSFCIWWLVPLGDSLRVSGMPQDVFKSKFLQCFHNLSLILPEDVDSMALLLPYHYTVPQPRRTRRECFLA